MGVGGEADGTSEGRLGGRQEWRGEGCLLGVTGRQPRCGCASLTSGQQGLTPSGPQAPRCTIGAGGGSWSRYWLRSRPSPCRQGGTPGIHRGPWGTGDPVVSHYTPPTVQSLLAPMAVTGGKFVCLFWHCPWLLPRPRPWPHPKGEESWGVRGCQGRWRWRGASPVGQSAQPAHPEPLPRAWQTPGLGHPGWGRPCRGTMVYHPLGCNHSPEPPTEARAHTRRAGLPPAHTCMPSQHRCVCSAVYLACFPVFGGWAVSLTLQGLL